MELVTDSCIVGLGPLLSPCLQWFVEEDADVVTSSHSLAELDEYTKPLDGECHKLLL